MRVRLRLGEGKVVCLGFDGPAEPALKPVTPISCGSSPLPVLPQLIGTKPVVALVEAVPTGAEELALVVADVLEASGRRAGVVGLDKQNRLGSRLGQPAQAPPWLWRQASADLLLRKGPRVFVPGPAAESEIGADAVESVLHRLQAESDGIVIDLGCRWEPKLFRPVLFRATHIWVVTRAGQWSGAEMRLEQAEFSGWTDMQRVRVVVIGEGLPPNGLLGRSIAAVLREPAGEEARSFVARELGRG